LGGLVGKRTPKRASLCPSFFASVFAPPVSQAFRCTGAPNSYYCPGNRAVTHGINSPRGRFTARAVTTPGKAGRDKVKTGCEDDRKRAAVRPKAGKPANIGLLAGVGSRPESLAATKNGAAGEQRRLKAGGCYAALGSLPRACRSRWNGCCTFKRPGHKIYELELCRTEWYL